MMLCSLTDLKNYLSISGTSKDDYLTILIKKASALINNYVGYNLARGEYSEELHISNLTHELQLKNQPIQSVEEVKINGGKITDYKLIPELTESGMLYRSSGWGGTSFTRGMTEDYAGGDYCIEVSYTAGYYLPNDTGYTEDGEGSLPYAIICACMECVSEMMNTKGKEGIKAHSEGGISTTFSGSEEIGEGGLSKKICSMLEDYRRYGVA